MLVLSLIFGRGIVGYNSTYSVTGATYIDGGWK
jgi:hypothetical protein